ncbi:hypothetical protein FRB95_000537 [Tulasnella sp. JGI-2019a]|nr:hypothetical protein FRB95_000537 [Tulasnella sp. JGI-2019a]
MLDLKGRRRSGHVISQQLNPPPLLYGLPTELLFGIAETLESEDLQQLLRVCRTMRPVAEVHLYQHIVIPWFKRHRVAQLLRTLRNRQDLAVLVLSFQRYLTPQFRTSDLSHRGLGRINRIVRWLRRGASIKEQISNFGTLMARTPASHALPEPSETGRTETP